MKTPSTDHRPRRLSWMLAMAAFLAAPVSGAAEFTCCVERELAWNNGDTNLAGVLLRPVEKARVPAAVLIQGSGDSDRSNQWARFMAETLVSRGVAVLLTDKRGSGKSGGDWRTASFEDLARDALAGVQALRQAPGIREDRIGLLGLSQGGRIAPVAASLGDVQFIISLVAGALPARELLFHELEQTYRQYGFDDEPIRFLQKMTELSFVYLETGDGFDDYLVHRQAVQERFGEVAVASWPDRRDHWYWVFWGHIHDFDPIPYWRATVDEKAIPSFIAYGELDEQDNVPVQASVRRLEEELDGETLTVRVYPDTGHSLMDETRRQQGDWKLVEGLSRDLDAWLQGHVLR